MSGTRELCRLRGGEFRFAPLREQRGRRWPVPSHSRNIAPPTAEPPAGSPSWPLLSPIRPERAPTDEDSGGGTIPNARTVVSVGHLGQAAEDEILASNDADS